MSAIAGRFWPPAAFTGIQNRESRALPMAPSRDSSGAGPPGRLGARRAPITLSLLALAWLAVFPHLSLAASPPQLPRYNGRVLIIRGIFNVFSWGLDDLACELTQLGYRVDVAPPAMAPIVAAEIQSDYLRDPSTGPLVIIGHSMGGRHCCGIPWSWREFQIPVRLVVILDSNPTYDVADNVQRCVNYYVTNDLGIFHGRRVSAVSPKTELVNVDVSQVARQAGIPRVDHFNIDASSWIHGLVIREVQRSCATQELEPGKRIVRSVRVDTDRSSIPRIGARSIRAESRTGVSALLKPRHQPPTVLR